MTSPSRALDPTGLEEAYYRLYREFFDQAERKRRWSIRDDIPWDQVNRNTPPALADVVESFFAVELYLPDYITKMYALPLVRASRGRAWFQAIWSYEESKHSLALGDWLLASGARTDEQLADLEGQVYEHEWNLPRDSPRGMDLYALTQELAAWASYRNLRRRVDEVGDPALSRILGYIGVDERCHYDFYKQIAQLHLECDREGTLEELRRVLHTFALPALDVMADGERRMAEVKALDVYTEDIFFREVLPPVLAGLGVEWSELQMRDPQRKTEMTT